MRLMTSRLARRPFAVALPLVAAVAMLGACAPADEEDDKAGTTASPTSTASESPDDCARENLQTYEEGVLTIGTDQPAYEPWFVDDDPSNGKGFESAVAYAVADELGFAADEVTWTPVKFEAAIAPGPKNFDFDINQFSITEERREAVDFSSPYYDVTQAVISKKGSKADGATSLADLKDLKIGAQVGTTSFDAIQSSIQPSSDPAVFNSNDDAKVALDNDQVDAIVVDLPTAFYMTAVEIDKGIIVGQLPAGDSPEQFGLVLDKGSPLTLCVSAAVESLRSDGTLDRLEQEWLADVAGAPVLE
jgi:polar amino acid transport system substrate-binding protein